ncbi:MAG: 3-oxoacyl-ACP synthase III family protein [Ruminiclostridium sp.]
MENPSVDLGIIGSGYAFGNIVSVEEQIDLYTKEAKLVRGWGYESFSKADSDVRAVDLAVSAAKKAIEDANISPSEIDFIIYSLSFVPDYLMWDCAAKIQDEIMAKNADTIWINQACVSTVIAFEQVAARFLLRKEAKTALLVSSDKIPEAYVNRMESVRCILADGAGALVIRKGQKTKRWLTTSSITKGEYSELMRLEVGGCHNPFRVGMTHEDLKDTMQERTLDFFDNNIVLMFKFRDEIYDELYNVFDKCLTNVDVKKEQIKYYIYINDSLQNYKLVTDRFDVPLNMTSFDFSKKYGHMGTSDQLITLALALENKMFNSGDIIALIGFGYGWHWACTLIQI